MQEITLKFFCLFHFACGQEKPVLKSRMGSASTNLCSETNAAGDSVPAPNLGCRAARWQGLANWLEDSSCWAGSSGCFHTQAAPRAACIHLQPTALWSHQHILNSSKKSSPSWRLIYSNLFALVFLLPLKLYALKNLGYQGWVPRALMSALQIAVATFLLLSVTTKTLLLHL